MKHDTLNDGINYNVIRATYWIFITLTIPRIDLINWDLVKRQYESIFPMD